MLSVEVILSSITTDECEVRFDGQVTLFFQIVPGKGVWKTNAWADYDASRVVPKPCFLEALRQARCAIYSKQNEGRYLGLAASIAKGVTAEHAHIALQWTHRLLRKAPDEEQKPWEAATRWLVAFGVWSLDNERALRSHVSRLASKKAGENRKADVKRAAREAKKATREEDEARQHELRL